MKFNTGDFQINKQILYGTEDEIIYEEEKCGLMETWDALSTKYINNIEEQNIKDTTSNKLLSDTKICVDTLLTTAGLLEKNILRASPIRKRKEVTYNFKDAMINTGISILDKGIKALSKASQKIQRLDDVLFKGIEKDRDLSYFKVPIRLLGGQLKICFGKNEYVCLDSDFRFICPDFWKPSGLIITLRYENISYSTVLPAKINQNEILNISEYFRECSLTGKRSKLNLSIEIVRNDQRTSILPSSLYSKNNLDLFNRIIYRIIESKKTLDCLNDDFFSFINISLSNIFIKSLINRLETYEIISLSNNTLIDNFPQNFVLVSDKIYKFKRQRFNFNFFIDENRINIEF